MVDSAHSQGPTFEQRPRCQWRRDRNAEESLPLMLSPTEDQGWNRRKGIPALMERTQQVNTNRNTPWGEVRNVDREPVELWR